jgi:hypothetical protein
MTANNSEYLILVAARGRGAASAATHQQPKHQINVSLPYLFVRHVEIARDPMRVAGRARFGRMKTIIFRHRSSSRGVIPTEQGGCDLTLDYSD